MTLSMLAALTPTAVIVVSVLVPLAAVLAVAVALVALLGKKRTSQGGAEPQPVCRGSEAEDVGAEEVGEKEHEAEESGEPVRAAEKPSAHEQPSEQTKEQSPEAAEQPLARGTAQDEPDGESVGELPCEGAGIIPEESAGEEEERTPDGECGEPLPEREVTDEGKAGLPYGADDDAWEDFVPGGEWSTPSLREVFACEEEGEDAPEPAEDARARKLSFSEKLAAADDGNKAIYNALKNELLSYRGVRSRVVRGGDYFRRRGRRIVRIVLIGRTMRIALALPPEEFDYNIFHQRNRGKMTKYADTPMFVKVKSPVGVKRAKILIAELMRREGKRRIKNYIALDYAREITLAEAAKASEENVYGV